MQETYVAQKSGREPNIARGKAKCHSDVEAIPECYIFVVHKPKCYLNGLLCDIRNSSFTMEKAMIVLLVLAY